MPPAPMEDVISYCAMHVPAFSVDINSPIGNGLNNALLIGLSIREHKRKAACGGGQGNGTWFLYRLSAFWGKHRNKIGRDSRIRLI
jgi:hypothetical protein